MLKKLSYLVFSVMLIACGSEEPKQPTTEEKIAAQIKTFAEADSVSGVTFLDTMTVENLELVIEKFEKVKTMVDSQLVRLPKKIQATKDRMALNEENKANAPDMLKSSFNDINKMEQRNLESFEDTYKKAQALQEINAKDLAFTQKAKDGAKDGIAYYIVEGKVGEQARRFAISPALEVLREFNIPAENVE